MKIVGEKITLIPLSINELLQVSKKDQVVANYDITNLEIEDDVKNAIMSKIDLIKKERTYSYKWNTYWLIVENSTNLGAGLIGFKGIENDYDSGELFSEVGYGVSSRFQNKGYATEALKLICEWSRGQDVLDYVFAQTSVNNTASQMVLSKGSFIMLCENHDILDYELKLYKKKKKS
jgi:predicted acetyltransferase